MTDGWWLMVFVCYGALLFAVGTACYWCGRYEERRLCEESRR